MGPDPEQLTFTRRVHTRFIIMGFPAGLLPILLLSLPTFNCSPFELTEKYVEDFAKGLQHLKNVSAHTELKEGVYDPKFYDEEAALKDAEEVDFVVVGAGAAGAVLANRLTEVPEWRVLLLESGAPETPYSRVPAAAGLLVNTPYNWGYRAEPQEKACLGSEGDRCLVRTGRAVGGTSSLSRMLYARGAPVDYDTWADLGNDGWCYNDVLPYFKKAEKIHLENFDKSHRSQGGLLDIQEPQHESKIRAAFLEAGHELGQKTVDYNGGDQLGFSAPQQNTFKGKRVSVAKAYLEPAMGRKNLSVRPFSHAVDILITPHTKNTSGVKYVHGGKMFVAKAKKEVIVTGGAVNSAQLLMLSGIGPKENLERAGVEVIHELPVGENLNDHVAYVGLNFVSNETLEESDFKKDLTEWLKDGVGIMSKTGIEGIAYLKTDKSKSKKNEPDIELLLIPHAFNTGFKKIKTEYGISKSVYETLWEPIENHKGLTILVSIPHPKSKGSVKLRSKDPFNYPIINANYFTDEDGSDLKTMIAGIKKAVELTKTEPFKKLGLELNPNRLKACEKFEQFSDDDLECSIRHLTVSLGDPSGTTRMGPDTDKGAVVDKELKVRGVEGLRVADAGVIPNTMGAHMTAPEVMIGEKAAEIVKKHWH